MILSLEIYPGEKFSFINKEQINELTEKLYQAISNTIDQLKNEGLWSHTK